GCRVATLSCSTPMTTETMAEMMTGTTHPVSGQLDQIAPGVRRLVARNPGYMTGPGTNTYLIGTGSCVVLDPGPQDSVHIERILAETGGRIEAVLATHTHPDHSPAAAALAAASGAIVLG